MAVFSVEPLQGSGVGWHFTQGSQGRTLGFQVSRFQRAEKAQGKAREKTRNRWLRQTVSVFAELLTMRFGVQGWRVAGASLVLD